MAKADREFLHEDLDELLISGTSSLEGEDRRLRGERVWVDFSVIVTHRGNPIQGLIEAVNLSWSGMLLATNFPLNINDQLTLEFRLPDSDIPVSAKARVIHRKEGLVAEEATMVGVVFTEVDPNVRRMLTGYVLEHLPTP